MRRLSFLLVLPFLLIGLTGATAFAQTPPAAKAPDVAGKWTMALELSVGSSNPVLVLKQDGDKISGTYTGRYGEFQVAGKIGADRKMEFTVALQTDNASVTMYFGGELAADGQTITKGTCEIEGLGDGSWTAKRDKALF